MSLFFSPYLLLLCRQYYYWYFTLLRPYWNLKPRVRKGNTHIILFCRYTIGQQSFIYIYIWRVRDFLLAYKCIINFVVVGTQYIYIYIYNFQFYRNDKKMPPRGKKIQISDKLIMHDIMVRTFLLGFLWSLIFIGLRLCNTY